jgi:hypothetical protein
MLEKIILLLVSYFCVRTELRFLSNQQKNTKSTCDEGTESKYSLADSEMLHAMALETSSTFYNQNAAWFPT